MNTVINEYSWFRPIVLHFEKISLLDKISVQYDYLSGPYQFLLLNGY